MASPPTIRPQIHNYREKNTMIAALILAAALTTSPAPDTVTVIWEMPTPDGGWLSEPTAETATWPQKLADPANLTCGVWHQQDVYLPAEAPLFTADRILTEKEDWRTPTQRGAITWEFVYSGDCPTGLAATGMPLDMGGIAAFAAIGGGLLLTRKKKS